MAMYIKLFVRVYLLYWCKRYDWATYAATDDEVLIKEEREQKIIELKAPGYKSKEVAQMLGCSESTVNNFMTRYNKMMA